MISTILTHSHPTVNASSRNSRIKDMWKKISKHIICQFSVIGSDIDEQIIEPETFYVSAYVSAAVLNGWAFKDVRLMVGKLQVGSDGFI